MAKIILPVLVVGAFVLVIGGTAAADYLGVAPQSEQEMRVFASSEVVPEGDRSGTDLQTSGAIETGAIPGTAVEEPWMKEYGND